MHYIENTGKGDFTVTLLDDSVASPKIKYNLHDHGGAIKYKEIVKTIKRYEPDKLKSFLKRNKTLKLPFLYVMGRVDGTISIGGNNIYPEQIAVALQSSKYTKKINRFMIGTSRDKSLNVHFYVHVELKKGVKKDTKVKESLQRTILKHLLKVNLEFKEYYHNHKSNQVYLKPKVKFYEFDKEDMFREQDSKVKNSYILN